MPVAGPARWKASVVAVELGEQGLDLLVTHVADQGDQLSLSPPSPVRPVSERQRRGARVHHRDRFEVPSTTGLDSPPSRYELRNDQQAAEQTSPDSDHGTRSEFNNVGAVHRSDSQNRSAIWEAAPSTSRIPYGHVDRIGPWLVLEASLDHAGPRRRQLRPGQTPGLLDGVSGDGTREQWPIAGKHDGNHVQPEECLRANGNGPTEALLVLPVERMARCRIWSLRVEDDLILQCAHVTPRSRSRSGRSCACEDGQPSGRHLPGQTRKCHRR